MKCSGSCFAAGLKLLWSGWGDWQSADCIPANEGIVKLAIATATFKVSFIDQLSAVPSRAISLSSDALFLVAVTIGE
jgi:hypothetical protein